MSDDSTRIPSGRLGRLARLASLTARTASDLAVGKAKRALGDDGWEAEKQAARKMLETLGTMKGAAMKLGQQLAMEADALPPEAREIVSRLYAQAPAMSYEDIAQVVTEELGDPPEVVFAEFEKTALASASLGQVHRARLKDGTPVAVKVQYPGVAEALVNDLKNAALFVRAFGGAGKAFTSIDPKPYYEEIRTEIGAETDYLREARLAGLYAEALAGVEGVRVPKVFAAYSSKAVLAMEFLEGQPLQVFAASDADAQTRAQVARQLATAILLPFLKDRMIHADPHPGNFLVAPDGALVVLDFGAVKTFSPAFVAAFTALLRVPVEDETADLVAILESGGFRLAGDVEVARRMLDDLMAIASRPLVVDEYDWAACRIVADVRSKYAADLRDLLSIHGPPESLLFYRAIGGLANNLKAVGAVARSRETCRALLQAAAKA